MAISLGGTIIKLKKDEVDGYHFNNVINQLVDGEKIVSTYRVIRDFCVFTNKRIIAVNVMGVTGEKTEYISFPYAKVESFAIQTAGPIGLDTELVLDFVAGTKLDFLFTGESDILKISQVIGSYVLQ